MPIYAYQCASCGHQEDEMQKVSDAPLTICPKCGQASYGKMLTAAGFQLKGSGWYAPDFKGGSASKNQEASAQCLRRRRLRCLSRILRFGIQPFWQKGRSVAPPFVRLIE